MSELPDVGAVREIVVNAARDARLDCFALRDRSVKDDGSVVTETDHRVQAFISRELLTRWPAFGFMGEEMEHGEQKLETESWYSPAHRIAAIRYPMLTHLADFESGIA
ncbi:MAG: hypothetical protein GY826_01285, partial [Fuerstiella sp.]|nr:hypothetical protein [Fuerstiella sp.]